MSSLMGGQPSDLTIHLKQARFYSSDRAASVVVYFSWEIDRATSVVILRLGDVHSI